MTTVKAIRIDNTKEVHLKILNAMFDEGNHAAHVNYVDLVPIVKESKETIRYNVRKLLDLGYIRERDDKYEPTEKVILLKKG